MNVTYNPTHNTLTIQLPDSITGQQISRFVGGLYALLALAQSPELLVQLKGAAMGALFALAFRLNIANQCTPDLDTLEDDTGYSRATLVKGLDTLEAQQSIVRVRRNRQSTLYRLPGYERLLDAEPPDSSLESKPEQTAADKRKQDELWEPVRQRLREVGVAPTRIKQMITICRNAGRSHQWALTWITVFEDRRDEGSGKARGPGFVIVAIEDGWELPDNYKLMALTPEELEEKERRDRMSYIEGPYAHLIEH